MPIEIRKWWINRKQKEIDKKQGEQQQPDGRNAPIPIPEALKGQQRG
jgi:hypothetical protein